MKKKVNDIERKEGVRIEKVERVLNESKGVREKKSDRVMEEMNMMGYVRDVGEENIERGRIYKLDLILKEKEKKLMMRMSQELYEERESEIEESVRIKMRMVKELDEEEIVDEMDESEERKKEGVEFVEIDKDKVREG